MITGKNLLQSSAVHRIDLVYEDRDRTELLTGEAEDIERLALKLQALVCVSKDIVGRRGSVLEPRGLEPAACQVSLETAQQKGLFAARSSVPPVSG